MSKNIPMAKFGKDHWSLLGYVECLCVDGQKGIGTIDNRRVRCNTERHPMMAGIYHGPNSWKADYGTRLAGYFHKQDRKLLLTQHDDWDCLDDLEDAGLIEVVSIANGFVKMTTKGNRLSALLREHKSNGGIFATFSGSSRVAA